MIDAAAPGLLRSGAAHAVVTGFDRVAANGDVANKVGTYGLALAAHAAGIPFVAAGLIARGEADAVVVGCDRVAANGDVANKVGTYALALAAHAAGIPFVVAGPTSTIDMSIASGDEIVIEERAPEEVRHAGGALLTADDTPCRNPAFDVTPAELVTGLVTERGIAAPPTRESIAALLA